jgi:hypothetical protein
MKRKSMTKLLPRTTVYETRASAAKSCSTLAAISVSEQENELWAFSTPEAIARAARDLFGADALQAIGWCELSARNAQREADLRFWRAVLVLLDEPEKDGEP